jgi:hypothetical protein
MVARWIDVKPLQRERLPSTELGSDKTAERCLAAEVSIRISRTFKPEK